MRRLAAIVILLGLHLAPLARAQEPVQPTKPETKRPSTSSNELSHKYQFGLGVRAGTGYRVIAPYHDEFCGQNDDKGNKKSVCGSRQPFWLELSPSFGVTSSLEVLVDVRLSLEADFTATRATFIAPGIKYYTDPGDLFKFFATGQVVFDLQDFKDPVSSLDIGVRSALGVQFDVLRYLGLFVQGGVTLGFKRWLTFAVDFAAGIQGRY